MKKILFFAIVVAAMLLACNKDESDIKSVELNTPFNLALNETAELETDGMRLTFEGVVEDSRCPIGVNCIWEGEAVAEFLAKKGSEVVAAPLTTNPRAGQVVNDNFTAFGHGIKLLQVMPYPDAGSPIEEKDYVVRVVIQAPENGDDAK